ncbi:polyprenyl synthetase family protein [Paradesulfitobacterium ferrireducens]|uniref:geranylgeranyl pyrophosphate synthase n=1 Tax=Paradesulfitobacterium ferrireducens TaxID=2816476 RepID=UPI001A8CA6B2|nr:geranylgeranyl pyrophosphate synthase [Paradesulfitobacterium ferrireducens]
MVSLPSIREELKEIQDRLADEISFKSATFSELIPLEFDELEHHACPAIVLAVSNACGYHGRQAVSMAAIIQFVFMADKVHSLMREDEGISEELRQFTVLVGDFLYGKFFLGLSRDKLLPFLAPIAGVIGDMSIGTIYRWLGREHELSIEEILQILERERASLTGLAARVGAELAGMPLNVVQRFESFGSQLGLAWAAHTARLGEKVVAKLMDKAQAYLEALPDTLDFRPLNELFIYMKLSLKLGEVE